MKLPAKEQTPTGFTRQTDILPLKNTDSHSVNNAPSPDNASTTQCHSNSSKTNTESLEAPPPSNDNTSATEQPTFAEDQDQNHKQSQESTNDKQLD